MTQLVKPIFIAGDEEKFLNFISKLKGKICLISHVADFDGVASAKITNKIANADFLKFVDYTDLNDELIKELIELNVNKVILTDLMIKKAEFIKELEKYADVLIIDHHTFEKDYNSEKTVFMNAKGYCAAYLCYYLFSKIQNIEELDWLAASASVSDWCYQENGKWMKEVYKKYNEDFEGTIEGVKKGKFWEAITKISLSIIYFRPDVKRVYDEIGENFGEIGGLRKYALEVDKAVNKNLERFWKEKEEIKDVYFFEVKSRFSLSGIISTIVSSKMVDKTILIAEKEDRYYKISARRQDGQKDMNAFLKELCKGMKGADAGGHFKASGGYVLIENRDEFIKRVKDL